MCGTCLRGPGLVFTAPHLVKIFLQNELLLLMPKRLLGLMPKELGVLVKLHLWVGPAKPWCSRVDARSRGPMS